MEFNWFRQPDGQYRLRHRLHRLLRAIHRRGNALLGAPVAPATLGPVIVRFIVDDSLHIPLTVGYFLDNGGKPGKQWGDYQIIYHNLEGVRFWGLTRIRWFGLNC